MNNGFSVTELEIINQTQCPPLLKHRTLNNELKTLNLPELEIIN